MAKIPGLPQYLSAKKTAGGIRYYWTPSPALARAGWKGMTLPRDLSDAIKAAERQNEAVEIWKAGGARPATIKKHVKAQTLGALIQRYRTERLPQLAASTRKTDGTALNRLDAWGGDMALHLITRASVRALRDGMMAPMDQGGVGHHAAFQTLKTGRTLFSWANRLELFHENPFTSFDLGQPPARDQMWETEESAAFAAAADALGFPGMSLAVALAEYTGQREADLIALEESQWREVKNLDRQTHGELEGEDGRVMGIFIRQGKTRRWVGIPVSGDMRARIEAQIGANNRRAAETGVICKRLLVNDQPNTHENDTRSGPVWTQRNFIRVWSNIRDGAIEAAMKKQDHDLAERLADLQFRDFRRTCVVRLGELGLEDQLIAAITGHKLETVKRILETYMPRTTKMAARAIAARHGAVNSAEIHQLKPKKKPA